MANREKGISMAEGSPAGRKGKRARKFELTFRRTYDATGSSEVQELRAPLSALVGAMQRQEENIRRLQDLVLQQATTPASWSQDAPIPDPPAIVPPPSGVLPWRGFDWVLTLVVECPHLERIDLAHSLRSGWHSHPIPTWRGSSSSTPECRATRTTWRSGPHGGPQTVPGLGALGAPSPLWDLKVSHGRALGPRHGLACGSAGGVDPSQREGFGSSRLRSRLTTR
ncbi:hypothetical protein ACMD2_24407 [Ananas comosus]|uniref:Uncharacterized protein n=1 Tax=Ananas comosus TaxID=4615 RepID=A0A199W390_ANACO|nr:hypothetical protein ACMD2_24407 [Ananas comosus]